MGFGAFMPKPMKAIGSAMAAPVRGAFSGGASAPMPAAPTSQPKPVLAELLKQAVGTKRGGFMGGMLGGIGRVAGGIAKAPSALPSPMPSPAPAPAMGSAASPGVSFTPPPAPVPVQAGKGAVSGIQHMLMQRRLGGR